MSQPIDLSNPPERYWHCAVTLTGGKDHSIVNDLSFADLQRTIVLPWTTGKTFAVSGTVVRSSAGVSEIKITYTPSPQNVYAEQHNARMRANNIADIATDRRMLPLKQGTDVTYELLFAGTANEPQAPDVAMVEQVCRRLPQTARILALRSRKGKAPFEIKDEYDVQDLLHATLRAYLKYSVQEDPFLKRLRDRAPRQADSAGDASRHR